MPLPLTLALNGSNQTGGALAEDIRLARAAGFGALEMWIPKLEYALQGGSLAFVKKLLKGEKGEKPVRVVALNRLSDVIFLDKRAAAHLDAQTHSLSASAMSLDAPWIVVAAGAAPAGASAADVTAEVGHALAQIGKITTQYGTISIALAPGGAVTSVSQALVAALRLSGRSNVDWRSIPPRSRRRWPTPPSTPSNWRWCTWRPVCQRQGGRYCSPRWSTPDSPAPSQPNHRRRRM